MESEECRFWTKNWIAGNFTVQAMFFQTADCFYRATVIFRKAENVDKFVFCGSAFWLFYLNQDRIFEKFDVVPGETWKGVKTIRSRSQNFPHSEPTKKHYAASWPEHPFTVRVPVTNSNTMANQFQERKGHNFPFPCVQFGLKFQIFYSLSKQFLLRNF